MIGLEFPVSSDQNRITASDPVVDRVLIDYYSKNNITLVYTNAWTGTSY